MSRTRVVATLALGAMLLGGCTLVPTTSAPQIVADKEIPFGLLGPTIPGTNGASVRFITQPVYIVDATGHLSASSRIVPSPPVLATVLRQLILGPTEIETFAGYTSALPKSLVLLSASIKDEVAYVDLATSLSSLGRAQQLLAVGQLTLTSRDVGATKGMVITVGGEVQDLLLPNGTRARIVTPADFDVLLNS